MWFPGQYGAKIVKIEENTKKKSAFLLFNGLDGFV
jgi:hypothetical protein